MLQSGLFLLCTAEGYSPPPPSIRLNGGSNDSEGRVEIFLDGQWGTVCDIGWSLPDAEVACIQLGYRAAAKATSSVCVCVCVCVFVCVCVPVCLCACVCKEHDVLTYNLVFARKLTS